MDQAEAIKTMKRTFCRTLTLRSESQLRPRAISQPQLAASEESRCAQERLGTRLNRTCEVRARLLRNASKAACESGCRRETESAIRLVTTTVKTIKDR